MKFIAIFLSLLSFSTNANDRFEEKSFSFDGFIQIAGSIHCHIFLGGRASKEERISTIFSHGISKKWNSEIKVEPSKTASVLGCKLETLNTLVDDSTLSFGFMDAKITVNQYTEKKSINRKFHGCSKRYEEKIDIDFGEGIILSTQRVGKFLPADDCKKL